MHTFKLLELTPEGLIESAKWIKDKWNSCKFNCEICGGNNWVLADDLFHILGDKTYYANFYLMCESCSNAKFLNASFILKTLDLKQK